MGRISSKRIVADTDVIESRADGKNACVFNGLLVNVLDVSSTATAKFEVLENQQLLGAIEGTFASGAKTFTAAETGIFKDKNLKVGQQIVMGGSSANDGVKTITVIDATYTTLTLDAVSGGLTEPAEIVGLEKVASFDFSFATDYSKDTPTKEWKYTNGILCRNGLRVTCSAWTNLEAYVLHS